MAESTAASSLRYASDPEPTQSDAGSNRLQLPTPIEGLSIAERGREVIRLAHEAFAQTGNWVVFYRELLGVDGMVRRLFSQPDEMRQFERSGEFAEVPRNGGRDAKSRLFQSRTASEPERMITIRLPKSLHDTLKSEADETNLSINKLCISKLLLPIESRFVPIQQGRRRGRKPGPQGPRKQFGDQLAQPENPATE